MEVLQVAMVWICLIANPQQCIVQTSEPWLGEMTTNNVQHQCKEEIIKLAVAVNKDIDPNEYVLVSSGCDLARNIANPKQCSDT